MAEPPPIAHGKVDKTPNWPGRKVRHRKESYDRGLRVERWAGWIMRTKGFVILNRRYKAQGGEIDLVCRKDGLVVFLEVKYRDRMDDALYAITPRNQARIVAAAGHYIAQFEDQSVDSYRFDIMAFAKGDHAVPRWSHIESAFEAF
nr:YraN family protein [uncultured Cohaesibacter sp.]